MLNEVCFLRVDVKTDTTVQGSPVGKSSHVMLIGLFFWLVLVAHWEQGTFHVEQLVLVGDLRLVFEDGLAVEDALVLGAGLAEDEALGGVVGELGPIRGDLLRRYPPDAGTL